MTNPRSFRTPTLALGLALGGVACGAASAPAASTPAPLGSTAPSSVASASPASYALPGDRLFPESVAYDRDTRDFYVGGLLDGALVRGNAADAGKAQVVSPPGADGRVSAAGMKIDRRKRLWIAGGESRKLFVYQLPALAPVATFTVGSSDKGEKRVVNDMAITDDGEGYITDSSFPALYHVTSGDGAKLAIEEIAVDAAVVKYTGAYNLNGVVVTPDQRALILVQTSTGKVFRFERATRTFSAVDLAGGSVPAGDGLAIAGQDLLVACNATGSIARIRMADDFRSGKVTSNERNAALAFPTALAVDGDGVLVVSSQIDALITGKPASLPFTVSRVALSTLR